MYRCIVGPLTSQRSSAIVLLPLPLFGPLLQGRSLQPAYLPQSLGFYACGSGTPLQPLLHDRYSIRTTISAVPNSHPMSPSVRHSDNHSSADRYLDAQDHSHQNTLPLDTPPTRQGSTRKVWTRTRSQASEDCCEQVCEDVLTGLS